MIKKLKKYKHKTLIKGSRTLTFLVDPTTNRIVNVSSYTPVKIFIGYDYSDIAQQLKQKGWRIKI